MTKKPAPVTKPEAQRDDYLVFRIGDEFFAILATCLRQILEPPGIVSVPNTPTHFLGVINLRGEILGVLDLRGLFDLGAARSFDDERLIVLKHERRSVALVADEVLSIETVPRLNLEPVPMDLPELHRRTFQGQVRVDDDRTVSIMDPSAIFVLPQYQVNTKSGGGVRTHG